MAQPTSFHRRQRSIAPKTLRVAILCCAVGIAMTCASCESEKDRKARETAALQTKFNDLLKAENAATARALEERARTDLEKTNAAAVQTQAESEAAFAQYLRERPSMTGAEEGTATELGLARLKARMTDPDTLQIRNAHLNGSKNAVCAEVNYKDAGKYLGYRRAYVTADVIWVEPAADDATHQAFEQNLKRTGCDSPEPPP